MFISIMFWYMSKSILLMTISIISTTILLTLENFTFLSMDLNLLVEIPFPFVIMIDKQSMIFISTVSTVSSIIVIYSYFYLEQENTYVMKKFLYTLIMFILSMMVLSLSASLLSLMVGWDGLGITSFCLIIFYQNWKSFSSGMVTFLSNRAGDLFMILSMVMVMLNQSPNSWSLTGSFYLALFLSLGAISKSAQLPYSFWLPQAMAAPTPVSALVHSSTLVTAGVFVMCRYTSLIGWSWFMIFMISSLTIILSGTSSLMEYDMKKVIALSTLCHISLMIMFSSIGETDISLFHLSMHAFFKSLLFMISGYLIHKSINSQDIRFISLPLSDLKISFPLMTSILSMCGLPFFSGFFSKEALLMKSTFDFSSLSMITMFMINSFFSCAYCTRLIYFTMMKNKLKIFSFNMDWFGKLFMFSSFLSSFMGGIIMFKMISKQEEMIQSNTIKSILLLTSILGLLAGMMNFTKLELLSTLLSTMWKLDFSYKIMQKHFFILSSSLMWKLDEKGIMKNNTKLIWNMINSLSLSFFTTTFKQPFSFIKFFNFFLMALFMVMI